MSYQNGKAVLPEHLLAAIQKYVDGAYIYIPRKEANRQSWDADGQSRQITFARNQEIFRKYAAGISVKELAKAYFLSDKTVYGILAKMRI
ncbi:MAG: CD3324 family protein [Selenomonadaceae bacterium]